VGLRGHARGVLFGDPPTRRDGAGRGLADGAKAIALDDGDWSRAACEQVDWIMLVHFAFMCRVLNVKRRSQGRFDMNKEIKSEEISRRSALSLLGLAALGLAVPTTVLTVSDAEAQQPAAPTAPAAAPMTGTERRQERRTRRVRRRVYRRKARRKGREERRELRRTGSEEKK